MARFCNQSLGEYLPLKSIFGTLPLIEAPYSYTERSRLWAFQLFDWASYHPQKTSNHAAETGLIDGMAQTSSKDSPAHEVTDPTQPENQRLAKKNYRPLHRMSARTT